MSSKGLDLKSISYEVFVVPLYVTLAMSSKGEAHPDLNSELYRHDYLTATFRSWKMDIELRNDEQSEEVLR